NATITRNADGTITISGSGATATTNSVEFAILSNSTVQLREPMRQDLTGDDVSDAFQYNATTHALRYWSFGSGFINGAADLGNYAANRTFVASGDFNGDGNADILWRDSDGTTGEWLFSGGLIVAAPVIGALAATRTIVGVGDFNADGQSDIAWL